ncbi:hypothetical protein GCM10010304_81230 [Streptomyces roseoviolaceus]
MGSGDGVDERKVQAATHAEAVSALFDERYEQMVGFARQGLRRHGIPPSVAEPEDVVQTAFALVLARTEPIEHLRAYVFSVIRNEVRHAARRYQAGQGCASRDADVELEATEPAADPYAAAELRAELAGALSALPQQQRKAVLLTKEMGLTQAETARAMGTAPGTVATHVSRALVALRVTLGVLAVVGIIFATVAWGDLLPVDPSAGLYGLPLTVTDVVVMLAAALRSSLRSIMLRRRRRKECSEYDGMRSTESEEEVFPLSFAQYRPPGGRCVDGHDWD